MSLFEKFLSILGVLFVDVISSLLAGGLWKLIKRLAFPKKNSSNSEIENVQYFPLALIISIIMWGFLMSISDSYHHAAGNLYFLDLIHMWSESFGIRATINTIELNGVLLFIVFGSFAAMSSTILTFVYKVRVNAMTVFFPFFALIILECLFSILFFIFSWIPKIINIISQ